MTKFKCGLCGRLSKYLSLFEGLNICGSCLKNLKPKVKND